MRPLDLTRSGGARYTPDEEIGPVLLQRCSQTPYPELTLRLWATMFFPEDVDKQTMYLAALNLAHQKPKKLGLDNRLDWPRAGKSMIELMGPELLAARDDCFDAGDQLLLLLRLRASFRGGYASLSKSRHILEATDAPNRQRLEVQWSRFKNVAHLAAASTLMMHIADGQVGKRDEINGLTAIHADPITLLGFARRIAAEGLTYVPDGWPEPILSLKEVWGVPIEFPPIPVSFPSIGEREMEVLASYRGRRGPRAKHSPELGSAG